MALKDIIKDVYSEGLKLPEGFDPVFGHLNNGKSAIEIWRDTQAESRRSNVADFYHNHVAKLNIAKSAKATILKEVSECLMVSFEDARYFGKGYRCRDAVNNRFGKGHMSWGCKVEYTCQRVALRLLVVEAKALTRFAHSIYTDTVAEEAEDAGYESSQSGTSLDTILSECSISRRCQSPVLEYGEPELKEETELQKSNHRAILQRGHLGYNWGEQVDGPSDRAKRLAHMVEGSWR
ncbi:MAG: hypothetical protein M1828_007611 [Chrysothrix sp. TS-e1954]|nr:MAG: hypothetical protein M1828_007611 [Chrysothrix sp. TS-e1954]